MFKKAIIVLSLLVIPISASEVLAYKNDKSSSLASLLSYKEAKLKDDLYVSFDLSCMLSLVDERFETDVNPLTKHINPEKSVITVSYKF